MARVSTATRLPVLGLLALVGLGCGARSDLGAPRDEANGGSASNGGSGGSGGMGSDGGAPAGCGNGVVEGREQCDEGALNEDRPALSLLNENLGADFVPVQPVVGSANAVQLYAFSSQSAHTGFERVFSSVLFVYRQAGVGSLELKGKLADALPTTSVSADDAHNDILNALLALGYNEREAAAAMKQLPADVTISDGIRQALKLLSRV